MKLTYERILIAKAGESNTPISGSFELLPLCNMNCDMCYVRLDRKEMEQQGRLRTADEWIELAEQSKRVLLVDGDIRRPSQFLIFGMEPKEENELGEYLRGNGSLADVMVPCTRKHMLFMGGKNCYSSSTEMLNSDSFYKLMTACRKFVDYVIIDTPPAGIIGDAQIFAHCADAVMIVAKQNYMLAEDINEVMDAFRDKEGKVLGVVLNGVRSFSGLVDSPVGHYYGKYSKYGRYGNYGRSKGM